MADMLCPAPFFCLPLRGRCPRRGADEEAFPFRGRWCEAPDEVREGAKVSFVDLTDEVKNERKSLKSTGI